MNLYEFADLNHGFSLSAFAERISTAGRARLVPVLLPRNSARPLLGMDSGHAAALPDPRGTPAFRRKAFNCRALSPPHTPKSSPALSA